MIKRLTFYLVTVAIALGLFGWWGLYTKAGNKEFDEMAGMIPFAAIVLSAALATLSLCALVFVRRSK